MSKLDRTELFPSQDWVVPSIEEEYGVGVIHIVEDKKELD